MKYYVEFFKRYFDFSGKSNRTEFWVAWLFNFIISGVLSAFGLVSTLLLTISGLYGLIIFIPSLAIFWRRMHDTGRSGWNILWSLLPIVGWIIVLIFMLDRSK